MSDKYGMPPVQVHEPGGEFVRDLEERLRSAHEVVFLLVQRLGGEVELTAEELASLDPTWELESWHNPATSGLHVKCRKPKKEPHSGS